MTGNKHSILVVDSNEAFATILKEGLEQTGEYLAAVACDGEQALRMLSAESFDMVILDLGLSEPDGITFARTLREQHPTLRMMLIPLMGEDVPPELSELDFQGVLTKPFFFPELPGIVGEALQRDVKAGKVLTVEPTVSIQPPVASSPVTGETAEIEPGIETPQAQVRISIDKCIHQVNQIMAGLAQEIGAEAVILSCGAELLAHTGRLPRDIASGLAELVNEHWCTSVRMAKILGCTPSRFEQSVDWGELIVYSLALAEDVVLSAALGATVPLGMIRHSTKSTADKLRRIIEGK